MPSRNGLPQLSQGSLNAKQSPFWQHGHEGCAESGVWLWQKRWEGARLGIGDPCVAEGDDGRSVDGDADDTEDDSRGEARQSRPSDVFLNPTQRLGAWEISAARSRQQ